MKRFLNSLLTQSLLFVACFGSYDFHLTKIAGAWRIDQFKFNLKFIDGNVNLGADN